MSQLNSKLAHYKLWIAAITAAAMAGATALGQGHLADQLGYLAIGVLGSLGLNALGQGIRDGMQGAASPPDASAIAATINPAAPTPKAP